jgi:hypothetical protein
MGIAQREGRGGRQRCLMPGTLLGVYRTLRGTDVEDGIFENLGTDTSECL